MNELLKKLALAAAIGVTAIAAPTWAQEKPKTDTPARPAQKAPAPKESATEPKPRDAKWMARHEAYLNEVKQKAGNVDILMVGDSITDGWDNDPPKGGKPVWEKEWAPLKAFNIGIGGDRTQHVLWRLQNGEVAGIKPKVAVLMIGTNNLGGNTNEEIVQGVVACVKEIQKQLPGTKVLLLGVFPRGAKPQDPARARIKAINEEIAKLDDGGKTVKYMDIGEKFLDKEGNIPKEMMYDALHPGEAGYQVWADAIKPTVLDMMK